MRKTSTEVRSTSPSGKASASQVAAGTSRTVLLFTFAREPLLQRPDPESHQALSFKLRRRRSQGQDVVVMFGSGNGAGRGQLLNRALKSPQLPGGKICA